MIATSGFLTALKCTKFVSPSDPPDPIAGVRGTYSGRGEEKRGTGRATGERKGTGGTGSPFENSWIRPVFC